MKRIIGIARTLLICTIVLISMIAMFLGAVLQESYKLCPVTADEITEVNYVQN